ncbi:hypothetical protein K469DRAFT_235869, partial [Zopfia rhizophila CBS 207.26]
MCGMGIGGRWTNFHYIFSKYGITADSDRAVAVGWWTGGHLVMSTTGWTTRDAGVPPPTATLSFYVPVDFESEELDSHSKTTAPLPRLKEEAHFR